MARRAPAAKAPAENRSRIGHVDEVVAHPASRVGIRLVGSYVEPAVDGEGVGRNDLTAQSLGDLEPETALAGGCGADDQQGAGQVSGMYSIRSQRKDTSAVSG